MGKTPENNRNGQVCQNSQPPESCQQKFLIQIRFFVEFFTLRDKQLPKTSVLQSRHKNNTLIPEPE
jgi:hypothetical protein